MGESPRFDRTKVRVLKVAESDPATDLERLQTNLQSARSAGHDELADMTERTIVAMTTATADDFDRALTCIL